MPMPKNWHAKWEIFSCRALAPARPMGRARRNLYSRAKTKFLTIAKRSLSMATTVQPASGETTKRLINYRVDAGVAVIEICDPPANTYTYRMNPPLGEAILKARRDKAANLIV